MFDYSFSKIVLIITIISVVMTILFSISFNVTSFKKSISRSIIVFINTFVRNQEMAYVQKMTTQEMNPIMYRYNILISRLKLELPLFKAFPITQFKWLIYIFSFIVSLTISIIVFTNILLVIPLFFIVTISIICFLFSITIKDRLKRILDCIDTENILAANMESSASFALNISRNINSIPPSLRKSYRQYVINVQQLNYGSEEALKILDYDTGNFSHDFLSNVNIYENYRVDGFKNIFKDVGELNNIKKLARNQMDSIIMRISKDFAIAFAISYGSLLVEIILTKVLRDFYFRNTIGQIIFIIDLLIMAYMYLRINMLKAQEL